MDFELKKFKHDKASIIPIEEVYTDLDIKDNDPHDSTVGYRFDTPRKWAQDKSKSKSIGIRDLKLTPSSGDIHCRFVHFLYPRVYTWSATWNTDHYDIDYDNAAMQPLGYPNIYITNDIFENITPNNGFEEIITDILFNKLSDSIWREIMKGRKNADRFYVSYSPNSETFRNVYCNIDKNIETKVNNRHALPLPSTFRYEYDSDTSKFNVWTNNELRIINMTGPSTLVDIDSNGQLPTINIEGYVNVEEVDSAKSQIENCTHAYDGHPEYGNSELLMITNDRLSLKNIYALFNQHFPQKPKIDSGKVIGYEDDYSKIATIEIDHKSYYIPFIHKNGNSFQTIDGTPYTSFLYLSNQIPGRTANLTNLIDINNLNLNNVWDRIHLIYHASFAETRGRIIGRNNDHWDSPNKRFIVPGGDQDEFYLRFTTDGKHNILPIGCHFNVDLCFMLNTTNNTATGNHDHFR